MKKKREPYDLKAPGTEALASKIHHGAFVDQGTLVAFPMCFPGTTMPIVADESRVTALEMTPDGVVYGGTSGRRVHFFVGMFRADTGMVYDMGAVENADSCAAVCCGEGHAAAFVNGPEGGQIVCRDFEPDPFSLIQEWGSTRQPFRHPALIAGGERILHAVSDPTGNRAFGITTGHFFAMDMKSEKVRVVGKMRGRGRLAVDASGAVVGLDEKRSLWRFDPAGNRIERKAIPLPRGDWDKAPMAWSRGSRRAALYLADGKGDLFSLDAAGRFSAALGRIPLAPAGPMAVTFDGRVFGFCGDEIARMFCYDPETARMTDLGIAVSVIQRRRYGYVFGDAVVGREGEIVFGENDNQGHLWLYFPRIRESAAT
jgi:hypothetical protein